MPGYSQLLHVDLTNRKVWKEPTETYEKHIGGRGLNIRLLFQHVRPGVDALSPDNVLIFGTGPVAGTMAPSSARYTVTAKSPLTGFEGDSNSGGFWAPELRYAGYDGIVFYGRADRPAYLAIHDADVSILDASDLWGRDTLETTNLIKEKQRDERVRVACIGAAGENLVRFACVVNDYGRAAGRTGMGAVMGSKNLKAIAVRGTGGTQVARPAEFAKVSRRLYEVITTSRQYDLYHEHGVLGPYGVEDYRDDSPSIAMSPFKYSTASAFAGWGKLRGKEWWKTHWVKVKGCSSCHMHCNHHYIVRHGPFAGISSDGPEAESCGWMTSNLGGDSKDISAYAYQWANRLGMDTNEMGGMIGAVIAMYEAGVLRDADLKELKAGHLKPKWGDPETVLTLIDLTSRRQGIGDLLAEGPNGLVRRLGGQSARWVLRIKGMVISGDRRPQKGGLLNQMVSTRGADHLRGSPSLEYYGYTGDAKVEQDWNKYIGEPELFQYAVKLTEYRGKAPLYIWQEHLRILSDSFGVCSFNYGNWPNTRIYPDDFAELFTAATGTPATADDMVAAARRTVNIERAFNIREGWTRADDQPPERWAKVPKEAGLYKGQIADLDKCNEMLDEYYVRRGWDRISGLPTRGTLEGLGLSDVADQLEAMGKLAPTP